MVSSEEEVADVQTAGDIEWDVDMEIQLFYAMVNHKPVGVGKYFKMINIWEKLSNSITKEVSTIDIWRHLYKLYDMAMLEDTEPIPFPNHMVHFSLNESEYGALMEQKCKEVMHADDSEARKDSVSALTTKSRKESGSSHASTDTPSIKSEKDYDRRRDSRDSNASGPRDSSSGRKSISQRDKPPKSKISSVAAWDSPLIDEDSSSRRGRRRANTSTPPATTPAKRRRM